MNRNRSIAAAIFACALIVLGTFGISQSKAATHALQLAPQAMTAAAAPLDINTPPPKISSTRSRVSAPLLPENHRRPPLQSQDRLGEEEDSPPGHLQQNRGHDHRQAARKVIRVRIRSLPTKRPGAFPSFTETPRSFFASTFSRTGSQPVCTALSARCAFPLGAFRRVT